MASNLFPLLLVSCLLCTATLLAAAQVTDGPPRIRNVYIPSDELKVLFADASRGVLMPRDKILALWREAEKQVPLEDVGPADAVLTRAAYEARLDDHELRLTGGVQIATFRDGWQAIDLPCGGFAVESAQLDGEPAQFGRKADGTLVLLLNRKGRSELKLEMSAPLASKGGDWAATLRLLPVPASELLIRLDESKQLQVGDSMLPPDSADQGQQLFRVAVNQSGLIPLVISDRLSGGNRAPLVIAQSRSTASIEPVGLRWQVDINLDVYARATDTFELQLPRSVDVAEVEAPQLARWTIQEPSDGAQVVTLSFHKPFLGPRAVRLLCLSPIPPAVPWEVPTVKVLQAASHTGQVWVTSAPSLRVETVSLSGIRPERLTPPATDAARAVPIRARRPAMKRVRAAQQRPVLM